MQKFSRQLWVLLGMLTLSGCASNGYDNDPFEPTNRAIFSFNDKVDTYVLKPVAQGYDKVTPQPVQTGVSNFFSNFSYPKVILNQFLQGKFKQGAEDSARFLVNSTIGILGFVDVADPFLGLKEHKEDFGQTLGVWGVESGPYVMLPFFGPSTLRDTAAMPVDYYAELDEARYVRERRASRNRAKAVDLVSTRASLLDAEKLVSGDKYAFIRDAYMQKRENDIRDGEAPAEDPFLMDEDF